MNWLDWLIVAVPVALLIWASVHTRKYVRGVADYLVAGRVAGRYVICVSDMAMALSVITLVALCEQNYQTGFAINFWNTLAMPIGMFMALSGFVVYRWRQTRSLSFGQFIEMRYGSKFLRIFCAVLRSLAEITANAIGPAIATNFFIYYMGLPHRIMICGINLPCFGIIIALCLVLSLIFIYPGGRISLLITDSVQALLCYPIFVIIVGYIILKFSWSEDIIVTMSNRVSGESFINPYDTSKLRDFNVFAIVVMLISAVVNRGAWMGNDISGVAKSPHEQKMAAVLGTWRAGFCSIMLLLLAMIVITFMNNPHFFGKNRFSITNTQIRQHLTGRVLDEVLADSDNTKKIMAEVEKIPGRITAAELNAPLSQTKNQDETYFNVVRENMPDTPNGRHQFQQFRSLYNQMMMPVVFRSLFPVGLIGLFCLLMIMLLVSTDSGRIFNSSSTLMQDMILPLCKQHLSASTHLRLLRLLSIGIAVLFLIISLFFAQLDYINMFITIMVAVWSGGAGTIVLFGLYSRFGNLVGAWCAIIFGSGTSLLGLLLQRNWAKTVYPWLENMGWVEGLDWFLGTVSSPFEPWVSWSMNATKFPINSYEIFFISMVMAMLTYTAGSYLTYKPFNLDKLLHRGEYADENSPVAVSEKWSIRTIFRKLIGITPEYTRGDKIIAYASFGYTIVFQLCIAFIGVVIFNVFYPWPRSWWSWQFLITSLIIPGVIAVISTVWFMVGGIRDIRQLFIDLKKRTEDSNDNGQVMEDE